MVSRKRICSLIGYLCLLPTFSWSLEYRPWIGEYLEFEWRNSLLYQNYNALAIDSSYKKRSSNDLFLTTDLSNVIAPDFSVEAELTLARTRKQSWGVDHFSLAGRYVWSDDVWGDPITVTTGFVFTQAFLSSLRDISSFHHGRSEGELFISLGKEVAIEGEEWVSRCWGMVAIGSAIQRRSPWIRSVVAYDHRICRLHEIGVFANTLWGLGFKTLDPEDFHGYGSIQHQSVDLGLRYTYILQYVGHLNLEYSYRIYARNFPAETHLLLLNFLYTFGL